MGLLMVTSKCCFLLWVTNCWCCDRQGSGNGCLFCTNCYTGLKQFDRLCGLLVWHVDVCCVAKSLPLHAVCPKPGGISIAH